LEAALVIFGFLPHLASAPISTNTLLEELFASLRMPSEIAPEANIFGYFDALISFGTLCDIRGHGIQIGQFATSRSAFVSP
jgi:hypothetical protein